MSSPPGPARLAGPTRDAEPEEEEPWSEQEPFAGPVVEEGALDEEKGERHPLLIAAMDLLKDLHSVFRNADARFASSLRILFQGAGDAMGGLAQALHRRAHEDDPAHYGLRVTQLKRALHGAAFACGALFPLRQAVTPDQFEELYRTLRQLERDIFAELGRVRSKQRGDDA